jgi:hypothetical protein
LRLIFEGGDSDSNKCKQGYGGACDEAGGEEERGIKVEKGKCVVSIGVIKCSLATNCSLFEILLG